MKMCGCTLPYDQCCGRHRTYQPPIEWPYPWQTADAIRLGIQEFVKHVSKIPCADDPIDLDGVHPR